MQYGQYEFQELLQLNDNLPQASAWNEHPSKKATGLYKFSSLEVNLDTKLLSFNRSTYDMLTWIGDIGGLTDALLLMLEFMLMPFMTFNLKSFLLTTLFRMAST